jgi:hypothetical protein
MVAAGYPCVQAVTMLFLVLCCTRRLRSSGRSRATLTLKAWLSCLKMKKQSAR